MKLYQLISILHFGAAAVAVGILDEPIRAFILISLPLAIVGVLRYAIGSRLPIGKPSSLSLGLTAVYSFAVSLLFSRGGDRSIAGALYLLPSVWLYVALFVGFMVASYSSRTKQTY